MIDWSMAYEIIYALAARDGREQALFGTCAPLAREAFAQSTPGNAFPELWFELPLAGNPWFDLHVLTAREDLEAGTTLSSQVTGGHPEAFEWFAAQGDDVRQLALSWDVSKGDVQSPGVQLLVRTIDPQVTCDFLGTMGKGGSSDAYRTFVGRLPKDWFACYTGVFPGREGHNLRVECIPSAAWQKAFVQDPGLLERDLRKTGFSAFGDTLLERCHTLANSPFRIEFQFDVDPDGAALPTLGASLRFSVPNGTEEDPGFLVDGDAGRLMEQLEAWDLADDRWRLLEQTVFAHGISRGGQRTTIFCYPAFIKLRWRDGEPLDAKTYLIAGVQQ